LPFFAVGEVAQNAAQTAMSRRRFHPQGINSLPIVAGRASMPYARPHPQARQRSAGNLARPLCRRPRRGDRRAIGIANSAEPWEWHCGFYPGSQPGERCYGTAASFEAARAAFETAWQDYLPRRSETDFEAWREEAAWTAEKYRRFDRHERMPPDWHAIG